MYFKAGNGGATQSCLQFAKWPTKQKTSLQLKMYFPPRPASLMRCLQLLTGHLELQTNLIMTFYNDSLFMEVF